MKILKDKGPDGKAQVVWEEDDIFPGKKYYIDGEEYTMTDIERMVALLNLRSVRLFVFPVKKDYVFGDKYTVADVDGIVEFLNSKQAKPFKVWEV